MADNTVLNLGSGGDTIATDEIGDVKYPLNKIVFGDTPTDVSMTVGFPVALSDTDNAVLDSIAASNTAIQTAVQLLDNAISGTEMRVNVVTLPSLVAGDANIGNVDVLSVVPGTGATDLGKAEDAAHAGGDVGVMGLTVKKATAAATSDTDGDYQPLITDSTGRLHVKDKNSDAIRDALQILDNAIAGNEMQVDVVTLPSLPAGTENIGDVDVVSLPSLPAGSANIGDVDVLSVIPGTGATNLGKAEDAVHATGDVGVMPLAVRTDDIATLAVTDGDYAPLQVDSQGKLRVTSTGSGGSATEYDEDTAHTPGDAGTMPLAVRKDVAGSLVNADNDYSPLQVDEDGKLRVTSSGSGGSATEYTEDAATPGTIVGTTSMMERDDVLATVVAEGDWAGLRCTSKGALWVGVDGTVALSDTDNAVLDSIASTNTDIKTAVEAVITGSEMQVDVVTLPSLPAGSANIGDVDVLSVIPGTGATNLGKAEDVAHVTGDVGVMPLAVRNDTAAAFGADGDYTPLQVDSTGKLWVTSSGSGGSATEYTEDVARPTTIVGATSMMERDDILATLTPVDGDWNAFRCSKQGALWVALADSDQDIGSVKVSEIDPGTGSQDLGKNEGSVYSTGHVGVFALAIRNDADAISDVLVHDGDYAPLQVDEDGKLKVEVFDGGDSLTVDNGGTFAVQVSSALPAGDANIGNVDIVTLPSLVAGSANIGNVDIESAAATSSNMGAALMTNVIHDGTSALTPKFAKIDAASTDNTLVGLVSAKHIRVLSLFMVSSGTVTATFESNAGGTALTGGVSLVANSGFTLPFNPVGWFETSAGQLLNLELSAGVSVDGCLVYVEVPE